jgi:hypothetical protein
MRSENLTFIEPVRESPHGGGNNRQSGRLEKFGGSPVTDMLAFQFPQSKLPVTGRNLQIGSTKLKGNW